ncbi:MAG: radical SAM protein [Rhodospirillaceae bacterium]|jgi:MoaA/NifB/PqqE/SkfB family radical SAM enzyme|nr:radical SAM protein [Rhodospirillaceae bacterium]MBT4773154.1 radical SAM protein [Rhodospirillaceae bacterium]MBT5358334.1 radical SAM protein [Rhodospirillaceae bacterium]MBT5771084.1 radical SAM protein [Rhodospirillaceae bacterium]MBT6308740.1 radical SAM protein [Rhodospirillaceae bacterium]
MTFLGTTSTHQQPVGPGRLWRLLRTPVSPETRAHLNAAWAKLDPRFRTTNQMYGRQEAGCGATIGVMPKCDFACRGCYLGADANRTPELPLADVKAQLDLLRAALGPGGSVQLTDGEVSLRPADEVIEILRHARDIELIPMLMSHGDGFLRDPELLKRLMVEGGLEELSLHIDTTQRGRRDRDFKYATREAELMALRERFAAMIRRVRRETGRTLRVASTVTVTQDNLPEVGDIVRFAQTNADVFRMVALLPVAQVGRTEDGIGRITADALWSEIERGLAIEDSNRDRLTANQWFMAHPDCSRFVIGLTAETGTGSRFLPLSPESSARDRRFLDRLFAHFAGATFRADRPAEAAARITGMALRAPKFFLWDVPANAWSWARRFEPDRPLRFALRALVGRTQLHRFSVVAHHFMSADELDTPAGRERISHCAFKVPIDGELKSMCEVNGAGLRDRLYANMAAMDAPARKSDATYTQVLDPVA